MLVSHQREKLINAIVYFAENTKYCGKIKLFKLLYLLDFQHFRQTGRSVTGGDYRAWKMGPVPFGLVQEWDALEPDLAEAIEIKPEKVIDYTRETVVVKQRFDDSHFSKRELSIMQSLVQRFHDDYSQSMVNVTHAERGPWAKIWDNGQGNDERIPYSLSVTDDDPHHAEILHAAQEFGGLLAAQQRVH